MRARTLSDYHRFSCTTKTTRKPRTFVCLIVYLLIGFWLGAVSNAKYQTYTNQALLNFSHENTQFSPNLNDSVANYRTETVNFC